MRATAERKQTISLSSAPWPTRIGVDTSHPGRLLNCSIITSGPALGHGFDVDAVTISQVAKYAKGARGRWTHGQGDDALARHLGTWENIKEDSFWLCRPCSVEVASSLRGTAGSLSSEAPPCSLCDSPAEEAHRVVGDFAFSKSAHKLRPDGLDCPAPEYLCERALEDPSSLGVSIVGSFSFAELGEGSELRRVARLASKRDLKRADLVGDPAANPLGLSEASQEKKMPALQEDTPEEAAPAEEEEEAAPEEEEAEAPPPWAAQLLEGIQAIAALLSPAEEEAAPEEEEAPPEEEMRALSLRDKTIASLTAKVQGLEEAETERRSAGREEYLASLGSRAIESGSSPLPAERIDSVRAALALSEDLGRELGEAFLSGLARERVSGALVSLDTKEHERARSPFAPKVNGRTNR